MVGGVGSQPPVEPSESVREHERHDQDARPEDEHVPGVAQTEVADTTDEQVADGKVEEAPEDIDRRGRQTFPGRRCEGALEGMPQS
jgi:hypothetical protein